MRKVLVIDDTEEVRAIVVETLNQYGFSTLAATDGIEGVETALREIPDLIICDVRMPHLDGYQTLGRLLETPQTATIPFIFLTGEADKQNVRRGMVLGADDYLTKPFTPLELIEAVTTRLEKLVQLECHSFKKVDELRDRIARLLSRELTAPLTGIVSATSVMMHRCDQLGPDEVFDTARGINQSAQRLNNWVKSLH
jgi:two-component system sensor histidine kinase/response regulator